MRVISCLIEDHNLWLVMLAAVVCIIGCFVTMRLLDRAIGTEGMQRTGWICQTAAAAGASVWCTHFVAILAYDPKTPVDFDPILTIGSLGVAIAGFGLAFGLIANSTRVWTTVLGGALVGLTVSAMHYSGMAAYHISGIVEWSGGYVTASVALSVLLASGALYLGVQGAKRFSWFAAPLALVVAIVSLHFTGMAAVSVTPLASGVTNAVIFQSMAVAIAGVSLFIVGYRCRMPHDRLAVAERKHIAAARDGDERCADRSAESRELRRSP